MKLPFLPARATCYLRELRRTGCYPRDHRVPPELREIMRARGVVSLYRGFNCCCDVAITLGMCSPASKLPTPYYLL